MSSFAEPTAWSSRSTTRASPAEAARRTSVGQGAGSPALALSATWTYGGGDLCQLHVRRGREGGSADAGCPVAEAQATEGVGPQATNPAGVAASRSPTPRGGGALRRRPRRPVALRPLRRGRSPARLDRCARRVSAPRSCTIGGARPPLPPRPPRGARRLPSARRRDGPEARGAVDAGARSRRDDEDGRPVQPVLREQASGVASQRGDLRRREEVGLVEDDRHRLVVGGERSEVAVVKRGVCVLLRLDDPDEERAASSTILSTSSRCAASTESKSGRSRSTRPRSPSSSTR